MGKRHRFKRLGGWLLAAVLFYLLQVCGVVLQFGEGGLLDILRGWSMYDGARGWLLLASQALSLLLIIAYVFVAVELMRRDPYFLRTRQLALAVAALDALVRLTDGLAYGFTGFALPMLALQGAMLLFSVIFVMGYYTRSVRVRTFMGSGEYLRLGFLTKRAKGPRPAVEDEKK
ncbi:MAG: hypothetical protein LBB75_00840 [Oscillospiraceae bacterium]|jgi:hypothetical protein|nr:hypothetical protein [Oscillospiraceae bacterium]